MLKLSRARPRVAFISGASSGATRRRQNAAARSVVNNLPPINQNSCRFHRGRESSSTRGIPLRLSLLMVTS